MGPSSDLRNDTVFSGLPGCPGRAGTPACGSRRSPPFTPSGEINRYQYEGLSSDLRNDTAFFGLPGCPGRAGTPACGSRRSPPVPPNGEINRYQYEGPSSDLRTDTAFFGHVARPAVPRLPRGPTRIIPLVWREPPSRYESGGPPVRWTCLARKRAQTGQFPPGVGIAPFRPAASPGGSGTAARSEAAGCRGE